jgi:protein TonB
MRRATLGAGEAALSVRERELRMLEYAIAASIALHLLAFAALQVATPRPEPVAPAAGALIARLVEPQAPALAASPARSPASVHPEPVSPEPVTDTKSESKPLVRSEPDAKQLTMAEPKVEPAPPAEAPRRVEVAPKVESKIKPEPAHRTRPRPKPKLSANAQPSPKAESARSVRPADVASTSPARAPASSAAPKSSPAAMSSAAQTPTPGPSSAAVDEDLLARYRLQLISAARRYKRYPRAALDNQWEGASEVAMVIGDNGRIREITISKSSGHEVLDRQAIDMFRKAKPLVPIPMELRGREFRVTLKAIYSLRDPGA